MSSNKRHPSAFWSETLWRFLGPSSSECFFEEKVCPSGCSPRASCYLEQVAGGSCLEVALFELEYGSFRVLFVVMS